MGGFRVTKKRLKLTADMVNYETAHKVTVCFTQGCGVYLTIDGIEYSHKCRDGSYTGITNKEAYNKLNDLYYAEKRKSRVELFSYRLSNAGCAAYGVDCDGFKFTLYQSGLVEYKTYTFSDILNSEKRTEIAKDVTDEIIALLDDNTVIIEQWKENTNNGSCDGSFNTFVFRGKKISALNICETDIEKLKSDNPDYYISYVDTILQENNVIKLFKKICDVLTKSDIHLTLNDCVVGANIDR